MDQQTLIDNAHAERKASRLKSGDSTLTFCETPFNDEGLALLLRQRPDLEGLFLSYTQVTDACVDTLLKFENLREINIHNTALSEFAWLRLASQLGVREWVLPEEFFKREFVEALAANPHVVVLRSNGPLNHGQSRFIDHELSIIAGSHSIKELDIRNYEVAGDCIPDVAQMNLERLHLCGNRCPSEHLSGLNSLRHLLCLNLSHTLLEDDDLEKIIRNMKLKELFLSNTHITDNSIEVINATQQLEAISIEDCQISRKAILSLATMRSIDWISFRSNQATEELFPKFQAIHGGAVLYK